MPFFGHFLVSKLPTLHTSAPILVANQPSDLWPSFIQKAFLKIFSKKNQKNQKIQKKHIKNAIFFSNSPIVHTSMPILVAK